MAQYIPKNALLAEIKRLKDEYLKHSRNKFYAKWSCGTLDNILSFLDTLEVKEVDLDFMLHEYWDISPKITIDCLESVTMTKDEMINFAKHFFELGLSVSNSTKVTIPDIDDVLKENGVNPDSKEAKIIKESYFMSIEKLTQKGEQL